MIGMAVPEERRRSRGPVVAAVMLSMFMVSVESTVVSTVMPTIVADVGGLDFYAWVFAGFLLAQTTATVIFGKLADLLGRRAVMLGSLGLFAAASLGCGLAPGMAWLVLFRVLQGIGAGGVQPTAMTVIGDLFPGAERAKVQGWLSSVWVVSSLGGPVVGGLIVHVLSWSWVFWINLPLAALAAAAFVRFLPADRPTGGVQLDLVGAALFLPASTGVMLALNAAGEGDGTVALWALVVGVVTAVLFLMREARAPDPLISLELWREREVLAANGVTILGGAALMCLITFLPIYVQAVLQRPPVTAGLTLTMAMFGWPLGAIISSRVFPRIGLRPTIVIGALVMSAGSAVFLFAGPTTPPVLLGAGSLIFGLGIGTQSVGALVLVQSSVARGQRGSATASNMFSRTLGSAVGAVMFGTVVNMGLAHAVPPITAEAVSHLLSDTGAAASVDPGLRDLLAGSIGHAFWLMLALCLGAALTAMTLPSVGMARENR